MDDDKQKKPERSEKIKRLLRETNALEARLQELLKNLSRSRSQ